MMLCSLNFSKSKPGAMYSRTGTEKSPQHKKQLKIDIPTAPRTNKLKKLGEPVQQKGKMVTMEAQYPETLSVPFDGVSGERLLGACPLLWHRQHLPRQQEQSPTPCTEEEDFPSCSSTRRMQLHKLTERASAESVAPYSCPLPSQSEGNAWKSFSGWPTNCVFA